MVISFASVRPEWHRPTAIVQDLGCRASDAAGTPLTSDE
jgi:hypothetical protein